MEKQINKIKREKEKFEKLKLKLEKDKQREQEAKEKFIQSQKDILYEVFINSKLSIEEFILKIRAMLEQEKNINQNLDNNLNNAKQGE